jgi:hypothetical protein
VIDYAGLANGLDSGAGPIERTSLRAFAGGRKIHVRHYGEKRSVASVIARARSRLGENRYCLATNNCEHFATWCITGARESRQVDERVGTAILGVATAFFFPVLGAAIVAVGLLNGGVGEDDRPARRRRSRIRRRSRS